MNALVRNWLGRVVVSWLLLLPASPHAAEVRVAVASNFLLPLKSLADDYRRSSGDSLRISAGSTGKLYAQIIHGAPFDVFLAANSREPERLEWEGHGLAGTRFTYALGRLALWMPRLKGEQQDFQAILRTGRFRRLALANPKIAPYGAASLDVLDRFGLSDPLKSKIIRGENISQAYQYVASGAAELGFVALAQLKARGDSGAYWPIASEFHRPLQQQALLLKSGADQAAARRFLDYLRSSAGRERIAQFGYDLEAL